MTEVTAATLLARASSATTLLTKQCGNGLVLVALYAPRNNGLQRHTSIVRSDVANQIIEGFDPDGSIRERSLRTSEYCLYK